MRPKILVVGFYDEEDPEIENVVNYLSRQEKAGEVVGIVRVCLTEFEQAFYSTVESDTDISERLPFRDG